MSLVHILPRGGMGEEDDAVAAVRGVHEEIAQFPEHVILSPCFAFARHKEIVLNGWNGADDTDHICELALHQYFYLLHVDFLFFIIVALKLLNHRCWRSGGGRI